MKSNPKMSQSVKLTPTPDEKKITGNIPFKVTEGFGKRNTKNKFDVSDEESDLSDNSDNQT